MDVDFFVTLTGLAGKAAALLLEYLKVVAWPLVVLILAFAFKGTIVDVLSRIREASGFGAKIVMTQRLEHEARELNEKLVPELDQDPTAHGLADGGAERTVDWEDEPAEPSGEAPAPLDVSPRRARVYGISMSGDMNVSTVDDQAHNYWIMMIAWSELEETAVRVGRMLQLAPGVSRNLGVVGRRLLDRGLISAEAAELGVRLQELRNRMVHDLNGFVFTDWMASDFADTARKLAKIYEDVIGRLDETRENTPG